MLIQMIISCCRCNNLSICTVYLSSWLSMQSILSISRHLCMGMTRKFIFYNRIKETQECCKHLFFYTFMYPRNNQKTSYIALRSISISGLLIKIGQPMKIYVFPYYGSCNKLQISNHGCTFLPMQDIVHAPQKYGGECILPSCVQV